MMRIVNISPSRSSSRLGVSQGVKLTSSGCESEDRGGFVMPNMLVRISMEEVGVKDENISINLSVQVDHSIQEY
jgi:hypothetical protein